MSCSSTSSGYSKLLIHDQSEHMQTLREIVRGTEQFRAAEAEGKLLRLPTGDGGLHPFWDPLRGDPRFEKIVQSLAPKEKQ